MTSSGDLAAISPPSQSLDACYQDCIEKVSTGDCAEAFKKYLQVLSAEASPQRRGGEISKSCSQDVGRDTATTKKFCMAAHAVGRGAEQCLGSVLLPRSAG
jgi:hypothetical protein